MHEDALVVSGPVIDDRFRSPSGSASHQRLCGVCHARIDTTKAARPGIAVVPAGTLDASDTLAPRAHIWMKRKQPWVVIDETAPNFTEAPDADFIASMRKPRV